jgi:hypothetical protein
MVILDNQIAGGRIWAIGGGRSVASPLASTQITPAVDPRWSGNSLRPVGTIAPRKTFPEDNHGWMAMD